MRNQAVVDYLEVGSVASLSIRIPVVSLGSGQPVLSILCGVHGDETASVMVSYRFIKRLRTGGPINGTVRIITAANPFAQATHSRVAFSDFHDLNRAGKGKSNGTLTERLAHTLFEFLADSTLVVDLHEFGMSTPTMAIYIPTEYPETQRTILQGIAAFEPAFVWAMDLSKLEEVQYSGSLVAALVRSGVASFGVETSSAAVLSDELIHHAVEGLYRIMQDLGICGGKPEVSPIRAYSRKAITANAAGLWEPIKSVFDHVETTDTIGRIIALDLISERDVTATRTGTILQMARRQLVDTGTNLFAIGTVNPEFTEALSSALG